MNQKNIEFIVQKKTWRLSLIKKLKKIIKKTPNIITIAVSTLVGLLMASAVIRLFNLDWRYISKFLYYQKADWEAHQTDPSVEIRYRLKPGVYYFINPRKERYRVSVNSLGFRGVERDIIKPQGVFRIICLGGSNVYGAMINDEETWPSQLEITLNSIKPGRYEVWNLGVSAYVASQMVALAEEAIEQYDPDLIIFALSNAGTPAFLWKTPIKPYFQKDPTLWERLFPEDSLIYIPFMSYETKIRLAQKSRLFRFALCGISSIAGLKLYAHSLRTELIYEEENITKFRNFVQKYKERVKIVVFICPAKMCIEMDFSPYYTGLNIPVFKLEAKNMSDEYQEIHPLPHVMKWYAENLVTWLFENKILPQD